MPFRWQDEGLARGSGKVALPSVSAAWLNRPGGLIHNKPARGVNSPGG